MTPVAIKAARKAASLTQSQAAATVGVTMRAWQYWEAGHRKMPVSTWELFKLKQREAL